MQISEENRGDRRMIRINQIKLPISYTKQDLIRACEKKLRRKNLPEIRILRRSLDSRKKDRIHYSVSAGVFGLGEPVERKICKIVNDNNVMLTKEKKYVFPYHFEGESGEDRPVIIGTGPAGYFAGYVLAEAGFRPVLLERGKPVEERLADVTSFWEGKKLDPESNVSFGEGGAGTFSDGKLFTGNKDSDGKQQFVLRTFHRFGAKEEITYDAKPHIGTDVLYRIMQNMRKAIKDAGGEILFSHQLTEISRQGDSYRLKIRTPDGEKKMTTPAVILAIGHSARDTFQMLFDQGLTMEKKPFAVGLRVEHQRELIDRARYGDMAGKLPAADYTLVYHTSEDRAVFSFCMCPGGYVVNASTEEGGTVVNGMSYSGRSGENSNSALVVNVLPSDIPGDSPMDSIAYQRKLEQAFFKEGKGKIPVQRYEDFRENRETEALGTINPCMKGEFSLSNIRWCLPETVSRAIIEAMPAFDKEIQGFASEDALLSGIESRTSSPVRICRSDTLEAEGYPGLFPCGEGAGYAGGIMSAAVDGIRVAEAVAEHLLEFRTEVTNERN